MSSPSTHRQRYYRERRRRGLKCVTIEVRDHEIAELTHRGLLAADAQGDRVAIRDALHMFPDSTLQGSA